MPYLVQGKRFHQLNIPGPKLAPEYHHMVLTPITVSPAAASKNSARYKAEHQLAEAAGDADELIIVESTFSKAELGFACTLTGVPVKYLTVA
jgi:hypothetical protein